MKLRVLVLLLALFVGVFAVNAQDDCMGLAAEDCQVLTTAMMQTALATSYNMDFTFDFSLSGLGAMDPTMAGQVVSANIDGTGSVAPGAGTNIPFNIATTMNINSVSPDGDSTIEGFEFYIVDDVFIAEEDDGSYTGITAEEFGGQFEQMLAGAPLDPATLFGGMGNMGDMSGFPEFTTFTRNADEAGTIPFQFTADFTTLFQSPEFSSMMTQMTSSLGDDPQMAQMGAMVGMFLPGLGGQLQITQYVGAEDGYLHKLLVDLDLSLDMAMMGGTEPIVVDLLLEVNLHDFGAGAAVTAPANVTMSGS